MLSAKYHIYYWIASAVAAAVYYVLIENLGYDEVIFQKSLIPLSAYAVYLICIGPYPRSKWLNFCNILAMGCLMVCLGSVADKLVFPEYSTSQTNMAVHTLLAFSTIGVLEPVRQNRRDIEACFFAESILMMCPRVDDKPPVIHRRFFVIYLYTRATFTMILMLMMKIINSGLRNVYGPTICWRTIRQAHSERPDSSLGKTVLMSLAVAPFIDLGETIFYLINKPFNPGWMPKSDPLLKTGNSWYPTTLSMVKSFAMVALFLLIGSEGDFLVEDMVLEAFS